MKSLFYILSLLLLATSSWAKTILVGKGQDFSTIRQALAAAVNGDTVLVEPGIYREKNIVITKSVYLKGIDYPVLDGEKKYENISVKTSNVVVEGFKVVH